jgi:hypothetical protein
MSFTIKAFAIVDFPDPESPVKKTVNPCCARGGRDLRNSATTCGKLNHSGMSKPSDRRRRSSVPEIFSTVQPSSTSSAGSYWARSCT